MFPALVVIDLMMEVTVNGAILSFEAEINLMTLLRHLNIEKEGIAVAVNKFVIPKGEWSSYQLKNNDNILIIEATQGG